MDQPFYRARFRWHLFRHCTEAGQEGALKTG